jgi:hypothetical protein
MKLVRCFLLVLLSSIIYSCGSDDNASLFFEKEYYERPLSGESQEIVFSGGSSNLAVEVSDNDVLEATIGTGKIKIKTKKKGVAHLVVKDMADNASVTIRVKVVDGYLSMRLGAPIPSNSAYKKGDCLFLVNNTSRAFYLYDESYNLKGSGSYKLFMEDSKFSLSLTLPEGTRLYDISNSSEMFLFGAIPSALDFSWTDEHEATTNSRSASPVTMNAVDSVTGDVYYFSVDSAEMPYGILN